MKNKQWRPSNWDIVDYLPMNQYCEHVMPITNAFEAGADAILEELRRLGNSRGGREENEYRNGTWVFLEEEK